MIQHTSLCLSALLNALDDGCGVHFLDDGVEVEVDNVETLILHDGFLALGGLSDLHAVGVDDHQVLGVSQQNGVVAERRALDNSGGTSASGENRC